LTALDNIATNTFNSVDLIVSTYWNTVGTSLPTITMLAFDGPEGNTGTFKKGMFMNGATSGATISTLANSNAQTSMYVYPFTM
jgi:hypothetical protein